MADQTYFVRSRGKIGGPFTLQQLQAAARQGTLLRIHEISPDRVQWAQAGARADIFAAARQVQPPAEREPLPELANATSPATNAAPGRSSISAPSGGAPPSTNYYYSQGGSTVGPVSLSALGAMASNGTLDRRDMVWADGAESAVPAGQVPSLIRWYPSGRSGPGARPAAAPQNDAGGSPPPAAGLVRADALRRLLCIWVDISVITCIAVPLSFFLMVITVGAGTALLRRGVDAFSTMGTLGVVGIFVITYVLPVSYFAILQGAWGQSLGKICGRSRVAMLDGAPLRAGRAWLRAVALVGPILLMPLTLPLAVRADYVLPIFILALSQLYWAVDGLFVICDFNGRRSLHDRIAGTRVVLLPIKESF